jgi:hypothetical protein
MKITFVFNNNNWTTIPEKIHNINEFFSPLGNFTFSVLQTNFKSIPFVSVIATGGLANTPGSTMTVDPQWYEKNVSVLDTTADIIVFVLAPSDLSGGRTSVAIMQGKVNKTVQCCIFGILENDHAYINMVDQGNDFVLFACHEISHALYLIEGRHDNTHQYFYTGNPTGVLPELHSPLIVPVAEVLKWDTRANASHSVRVLCDNSGLNLNEKNLIWACIHQESNFLTNPIPNKNKDPKTGVVWSTDYGIVQVNDNFHIGKGKDFPSVQYVLDNPEKCVQWMINMYKIGRLSMWSSYTSGAYKKFLPYVPII